MATWIPILVPQQDYLEIAALVAGREANRTDEASEVTGFVTSPATRPQLNVDDAKLAALPVWSVDDLRALASGTSETAKRWTLAMDVCCEVVGSDNHWLSTSEVADRTGMSINDWRDAPRKITRHMKANFPNVPIDPASGDHAWPLKGVSKPGSQEIHWAMNEAQAELWRQVRGL